MIISCLVSKTYQSAPISIQSIIMRTLHSNSGVIFFLFENFVGVRSVMLTQTINNNASEKKLSSNPQEISKIFFLIPDDWTVKYSGYSNSTFQEFPDRPTALEFFWRKRETHFLHPESFSKIEFEEVQQYTWEDVTISKKQPISLLWSLLFSLKWSGITVQRRHGYGIFFIWLSRY